MSNPKAMRPERRPLKWRGGFRLRMHDRTYRNAEPNPESFLQNLRDTIHWAERPEQPWLRRGLEGSAIL